MFYSGKIVGQCWHFLELDGDSQCFLKFGFFSVLMVLVIFVGKCFTAVCW